MRSDTTPQGQALRAKLDEMRRGLISIGDAACRLHPCDPVRLRIVDKGAQLLDILRAIQAAEPPATAGCINCGAVGQGGYETEDVGSFCADCWARLREQMQPPAPTREQIEVLPAWHGEWLHRKDVLALYPADDAATKGQEQT